jgi:XTP/dITP diphosphohydrolase
MSDTASAGFDAPPARIVLATANAGKHAELVGLLAGHIEVLARPPEVGDVVEDSGTLLGNARLKAQAIMVATGEAALADDTGLEVDALGGRPGVESSSFGGIEHDDDRNVAKLLLELRGVPLTERTARFRTVLVLLAPDGRELVTEGVVEGVIAEARSGVEGFGYDPVFVPSEGDGRTFARMTRAEKSAISHRGRALRSLAASLGI